MFQELLSESRHLSWPLAALVLFFLVFAIVVYRLIKGILEKKTYDHVAALPLDDSEIPRRDGGTR